MYSLRPSVARVQSLAIRVASLRREVWFLGVGEEAPHCAVGVTPIARSTKRATLARRFWYAAPYPFGATLGTATVNVQSFYINTWGNVRSAYFRIQYN